MKIILATTNKGKQKEIQALLDDLGYETVLQTEFDIPEAIEDGDNFAENALIKARHASGLTGLPAIADDSGLAVDALQGAPGIYSARYAGPSASDQDNIDKLLFELKDVPESDRMARFHCVIAMVQNATDAAPIICDGQWQGMISLEQRGNNGFGYDPVFYIPELRCTSAQLSSVIKNQHSHRAQALAQLKSQLV